MPRDTREARMDSAWPPFVILGRVSTRFLGSLGSARESTGSYFCDRAEAQREELRRLSPKIVERANDGHGDYRASREADGGAHCDRVIKALPGRNRWRGGGERGDRHTRLREKLCCPIFFFFDRCKVSTLLQVPLRLVSCCLCDFCVRH